MKAESSIAPPSTPSHVLALVEEAAAGDQELIMVHDAWCKGCAICVDVCPRDCLEMRGPENPLPLGERGPGGGGPVPRLTDARLCTSCGMCEYLCPDFAIHVLQLRWQKG